jgi:AraC-like DNA-binding protein
MAELGGQLAEEVGWSHKHLIAKFRLQVGLRPKTAARLLRFDGVWRRLDQAGGRLDWGQVAREVGYADQAHLIRDFHQFTGTTPTAFVAPGDPTRVGMGSGGSTSFKTRSAPLRSLAGGGRPAFESCPRHNNVSFPRRQLTCPSRGSRTITGVWVDRRPA